MMIKMEKSCPYRAYINGLVERANRSVTNVAKTLMQQSNLPVEFWAHSICTAAYILNRLSHRRLPNGITPHEAMLGKRPNNKHLKVFGCHAEVLIEKQYRRKDLTDPCSESAIFIGYCRQSTGYLFYLPHKHSIVSRRDAVFNETYLPARVGETVLVEDNVLIDSAEMDNSTVTKNSTNLAKNSITSDISKNSPLANSIESSVDGTMPSDHSSDHSPQAGMENNNKKLLLDPDTILRVSTKIAKAAPHIHERCTKADGKSISEALRVSYSHYKYPNDVFTYKMKDIKYDYGKGWLYLESPSTPPAA